MRVPRIFIGSSSEGKDVAQRLAVHLEADGSAETNIWTYGVFDLGEHVLDGLIRQAQTSDFAVLVLSPDDTVSSRDAIAQAPRDNVIFELGLFIGALGRDRTYMVQPHGLDLKLPSDLAGVTQARYRPRFDGDVTAALNAPALTIRDRVKKLGLRSTADTEPAVVRDSHEPAGAVSRELANQPQFDVSLNGAAHIILHSKDARDQLIENEIERARREEVEEDSAEAGPFSLNLSSARALLGVSRLTSDAFETKAKAWEKEIIGSWPDILNELASFTLAAPVIKVSNTKQQFLESVRIDILFKNATGLDKKDLDDLDLNSLIPPVIPASNPHGHSFIHQYIPGPVVTGSYPLTWRNEPAGVQVVVELDNLRPQTPWVSDGDDFVLIAHASEVLAEWRITARGYHQSFEGSFPVPVAGQHDFRSLLALTSGEEA
ncbi:nucleotide-binding protein [Pseudarthrobacter sp. CC4]|uniref:TIR domain-containing protein n=1 Tax=Pseudarthrobacter sp. CC4 TaxID=3029190 RepID=UPI003B8D3751